MHRASLLHAFYPVDSLNLLLRLSIGLESEDELAADLDRFLAELSRRVAEAAPEWNQAESSILQP